MDEWNYWYDPHIYCGPGTRYFFRDAMGIAAGLNEYSKHTMSTNEPDCEPVVKTEGPEALKLGNKLKAEPAPIYRRARGGLLFNSLI